MPHFEIEVPLGRARYAATPVRDAFDDLPRILDHLSGRDSPPRTESFRVQRAYEAPAMSPFARLMRSWPGLVEPAGLKDHVIRKTPRDFETFRRMKPDDSYPEVMRIAKERFAEEVKKNAPAQGRSR